MILAYSGDRFLMEEAARHELRGRGLRLGELPRLGGDGEEISPGALLGAMTPGLFGDPAAVLDFAGQRPGKELLAATVQAARGGTLVVLDPNGPKTRAALYREHGEHRVLPAPVKPGDIAAWGQTRAREQDLKLDSGAALYLAEALGDLASVAAELNKLALLRAGAWTRAEVEAVVGQPVPGDSFALLDAVTAGRPEAVTAQLRALEGEDPYRLLGVIGWQYRLLAGLVGLLATENIGAEAAAARLGQKPYPVKKALPLARRLGEAGLREQLRAVLEAERRAKGGGDAGVTVRQLVLSLCAMNAGRAG